MYVCVWVCLIDFHIRIDFTYKQPGTNIANCAANYTQRTAEQCHVPEIKCRLEQAIHSENVKFQNN